MKLPRLLLQVTHEWSSPSNKNMKAITNGTGFGLTGDDVSVFQVRHPKSGILIARGGVGHNDHICGKTRKNRIIKE